MRKSPAVVLVVGLFLAAVLLAVGCGGDDDNGGGSATAGGGGTTTANVHSGGGSGANETDISKKEFIRKAEAICRDISVQAATEANAMIKSQDSGGIKTSYEQLIENADAVVNDILGPVYREEIDRIRALGYPSGDEAQIEAMLTALEDTIQRAEADPEAFAELNTVEGNPENPYEREDSLARKYGFVVCPRV